VAGEGQVKGTLLVHLRAHVVDRHGPQTWDRLVAAAPPADRAQLGALIVTGNWYPVGIWNRALAAHLTKNAVDPAVELRDISTRVAETDLHTLFKLTLRLASPEAILRRSNWLWTRYFDRGSVVILDEAPRDWRLRLEAPTAEAEGPIEPVCKYGVTAWLVHALKLSGVMKPLVEHLKCRFSFSRWCEYRARF
jgi:hypothetical protein